MAPGVLSFDLERTVSTFSSDVLYALRSLRRQPAFALTVVVSLALGIGVNSAIFTLLDRFLFQSLRVHDREQIVQITTAHPQQMGSSSGGDASHWYAYPMYTDLRDRNQVLSGLLCRARDMLNVVYEGDSERVQTELVSGNFFEVLGVRAAAGRLLVPRDEKDAQAEPVAVLSHGFWKRRFGQQAGVVGQSLLVNGHTLTIVGVAEPSFEGVVLGSPPDVYVPVTAAPFFSRTDPLPRRRYIWLQILGRLQHGVSREQAQAALNVIFRQVLEEEVREAGPEYSAAIKQRFVQQTLELQPGEQGVESLRRQTGLPLRVLWAAVTAILLIACANAAALQLAQAARRRKEVAVRMALGASRWRLIRLLLTESLVLSVLAGCAGLLLAWWMLSGLDAMVFDWIGRSEPSALNPRIVAFTAFLSLASALAFGLVPAWQTSRTDLVSSLKAEGMASAALPRVRARGILIGTQVALSVLLLAGAGLFLRTLLNSYRLESNFPRDKLLLISLDPASNKYPPARSQALVEAFMQRVRALPGVRAASLAQTSILSGAGCSYIFIENDSAHAGEDNLICYNWITPGYLETLGLPLLRGRDFTSADMQVAPRAAVVNEAFARYFFGQENPLGRRFGFKGPASRRDIEIIGVVHAARWRDRPFLFFPLSQDAFQFRVTAHVRFDGDAQALSTALRREMASLDPAVPLYSIRTVAAEMDRILSQDRNFALLTGICGGLATLLAAVGLFGLLSFLVASRAREIGIRMALGAQRSNVVWLVARQTLFLTGAGIVVGIAAALALTRFLRSMLYDVSPHDPLTFALAAILFLAVALLAAAAPARRAASVNPATTLRYE